MEFLSDTVPRTTTYKKYREQRGPDFKPGDSVLATRAAASGQSELSFKGAGSKAIDILHPQAMINGNDNAPEEEEDGMDLDRNDPSTSAGANEGDSIQEQLAMEMGHASSSR